MTKETGGPAFSLIRPCARCQIKFKPKAYQIKYRSYRCPKCASKSSVESARKNKLRKYANNKAYFKRHPEVIRRKTRLYRQRYPEKYKARMIVQTELRAGRLVKLCCFECGKFPVEAHHDNYLKPLKIKWLCKKHHDELAILAARKDSDEAKEKV